MANDLCWPVNTAVIDGWEDVPSTPEIAARQDLAEEMAARTLHMLTAYRLGGCEITVRPCVSGGTERTYWDAGSGYMLRPYILNGTWYNLGCGNGGCGCLRGLVAHLPGPVGSVSEVLVDGAVVPTTSYRVVPEGVLRIDGQTWPMGQDITKETTEPGTMAVTYLRGIPVDAHGALIAGLMVKEYLGALTGGKCRLPRGVTSVVRAGISFEVASGAFPGGLTGLAEVDQYIRFWNPHHLVTAPTITSPDMPRVY